MPWGPVKTGNTYVALRLGLAACQKGLSVSFITAAALVNELMEARDERSLIRLQKQLAAIKLLIIDELGFVPLSKTGAKLLFELISQRYERGSTLITSNPPFDEWTETFGAERLTGALLDRLTHHVNILEMNGDSYRPSQSRARKAQTATCSHLAELVLRANAPPLAYFCAATGLLLRRHVAGFVSAADTLQRNTLSGNGSAAPDQGAFCSRPSAHRKVTTARSTTTRIACRPTNLEGSD